jgi:hypothetical protein
MSNQALPPADLFSEYVRLRQSGFSSSDAVEQIRPQADQLNRGERQHLGRLMQTWEARDGKLYKGMKNSGQPSANDNTFQNEPEKTSGKRVPIIRPLKSQVKGEQGIQCANCGKTNPKSETYCYACGHILTAPAGTKSLDDEMDSSTRWGTAHFGQFSSILIQVRGAKQPIEVTPQGEVIIGRSEAGSAMRPDIDLSPYNAENLGVSRIHASLKRTDNTIAIADLNSKNSTYINGQRLHPHEVRVLRDGDEVRLGKLPMKIAFKHQLKRINDR